MARRVAVVMAGGSGERFWPVSTRERPKQFLRLSSPDQSLLQEAVGRAGSLVGSPNTYVSTVPHLAERTRQECPGIPEENVLAEPAKRNTMGALVWVAANFRARGEEDGLAIAVLTADHRIRPTSTFLEDVRTALDTAEATTGLVTIGIPPDRAETGYGYVEIGPRHGTAYEALSFREKPDRETAERYVASQGYLWNSGMFFWTLGGFERELASAQPEVAGTLKLISRALAAGDAEKAAAEFATLPNLSIDYGLMERASRVYVVAARFEWDDLGAWDALRRSYPNDEVGNVSLGPTRMIDASNLVVYNESTGQEVCVLGVEGLVVVVTEDKVMVCPADKAQDVRRFLAS